MPQCSKAALSLSSVAVSRLQAAAALFFWTDNAGPNSCERCSYRLLRRLAPKGEQLLTAGARNAEPSVFSPYAPPVPRSLDRMSDSRDGVLNCLRTAALRRQQQTTAPSYSTPPQFASSQRLVATRYASVTPLLQSRSRQRACHSDKRPNQTPVDAATRPISRLKTIVKSAARANAASGDQQNFSSAGSRRTPSSAYAVGNVKSVTHARARGIDETRQTVLSRIGRVTERLEERASVPSKR